MCVCDPEIEYERLSGLGKDYDKELVPCCVKEAITNEEKEEECHRGRG